MTIIQGTWILSKLMYPNTEFDYEWLWRIKKSTDRDAPILNRKAQHGIISIRLFSSSPDPFIIKFSIGVHRF